MVLGLQEVCDLILYELYWLSADPDSTDDIAPNEQFSVISDQTSERFFSAAIERLSNNGHIEQAEILPDTVRIADKGMLYVDRQLDDSESFIWREDQNRPAEARTRIPAANRFVQLDHNSKAYRDAMSAGDNLIGAMKSSNFHVQMEEEEKTQRIAELEAGYSLLKAARVNLTMVKAVLAGTLAYLMTKFADEPIGELAKLAWSTLKNLVGLS